MDWLKKHFDRVILAVLGVLVLAFAGIIISQALSFGEKFAQAKNPQRPRVDVPTPDTETIRQRISAIEKPAEWDTHDGSLFVSEPYVIREGGSAPIPFFGKDSEIVFPPIPNEWIKQYHLDFSDRNLLNADPDGDKFSNLEEYTGKTDPTDPKSIPPYYTKLRLLEYIKKPFLLKFSGMPGPDTYSINTKDPEKDKLSGRTQFLKMNDVVEGTPYKLIRYKAKTEDREGLTVDVSELTLLNQETAQEVVLINDKQVDDPTVFAKFKYLLDGSEFVVKKLDSFSIKPDESVKYKLIDISDTQALIESPQKVQITVPKANQ